VTPDELAGYVAAAGLSRPTYRGIVYDVINDTWSLSDDTDVNYLAFCSAPSGTLPESRPHGA
jgi:2-polyprenyl-3-methyl-5-hydroxy-6-metoxy-1,4-benzoquinol methylase